MQKKYGIKRDTVYCSVKKNETQHGNYNMTLQIVPQDVLQ